ncbi:MAG TPA: 50S ribosomal protein L4, partial [Bacteroidales bacterium]|nr:50S ribosomal protein L4 [Bacteroidales bacterium]
DINSPVFVGGGRVFGPKPRDYGFKLNKKVKRLARRSALSYKAQEGQIIVIEDFNFEKPQTKKFVEMLKKLAINDKKSMLVLSESNNNVYLSSRNLKQTNVVMASNVSTYDILNAKSLILLESTLPVLSELLSVNRD